MERIFVVHSYGIMTNGPGISVVIPTCNRKAQLLRLLENLNRSQYPLQEVIIVDAGEERLTSSDYAPFTQLPVQYILSEKSVCVQRNIGIRQAGAPWIFLCDDDMEVPTDYVLRLVQHIQQHSGAGAVSGLVLQLENNEWRSTYPVTSNKGLLWCYVFQLSIWGGIVIPRPNFLSKRLQRYYQRKGNHLSRAGWPVITHCSGEWFNTPVYGLGASLIRREWLLQSPYDEVLDQHGIGDNYGVAMGFPVTGVHVVTGAFVYHHQTPVNRLQRPLQYYRRILALDYFRRTVPALKGIKKHWLLWSLTGNLAQFLFVRDNNMLKMSFKLMGKIGWNRNPYYLKKRSGGKTVQPV